MAACVDLTSDNSDDEEIIFDDEDNQQLSRGARVAKQRTKRVGMYDDNLFASINDEEDESEVENVSLVEERLQAQTSKKANVQRVGTKKQKTTPKIRVPLQPTTANASDDEEGEFSNEDSPVGTKKQKIEAKENGGDGEHCHDMGTSEVKEANPKEVAAYLRERASGVKSRTFKLSSVPNRETVPTGRTIKKMGGWSSSLWPALREFLQNTIDHLNLLDHSTGRRHSALTLKVTNLPGSTANKNAGNAASSKFDFWSGSSSPPSGRTTRFSFVCGTEVVCAVTAFGPDELVIEQAYTFPLPTRALDTGVPDTAKQNGDTAGGFGDGFKTAAVALLALGPKIFSSLSWRFDLASEDTAVTWDFLGKRRDRVGTFAACEVLEVEICKTTLSAASPSASSSKPSNATLRDNWMTQRICVKGVGTAFVKDAVPKLTVFWDLPPPPTPPSSSPSSSSDGGGLPLPFLIGMAAGRRGGSGGDFLADANSLPFIPVAGGGTGSASSSSSSSSSPSSSSSSLGGARARPTPGIYVRGIWVKPPKVEGCVLAFFGDRLDVSGRDRNDVDEEKLVDAVARVLAGAKRGQEEGVRRLLLPLCGKASSSSSSSANSAPASASWLLRSPRFFNRVLEAHKEWFVHDLFGFPKGAVFVSSKTTNSKDPFVAWAAKFLAEHSTEGAAVATAHGGAAGKGASRSSLLVPLNPGAHKALFEEVSERQLTERCVKILLAEDRKAAATKDDGNKELRQAVKHALAFLGLGEQGGKPKGGRGRQAASGSAAVKVVFSKSVSVAFVHDGSMLFCPSSTLTRALLVKTLNVVHSQMTMLLACENSGGGDGGDGFTSLIQAIFETLPSSGGLGQGGVGSVLTSADVDKAIERAGAVRKENEAFLRTQREAPAAVATTSSGGGGESRAARAAGAGREAVGSVGEEEIVVDDSDDDDQAVSSSSSSSSSANSSSAAGNTSRRKQGDLGSNSGQPRGTADLLRQIVDTAKRGGAGGGSGDDDEGAAALISSGEFAADGAGPEECVRASSALERVACTAFLGGGELFCDVGTASALRSNGHATNGVATNGGGGGKGVVWATASTCQRLAALRVLLREAVELIGKCLPSTAPLLKRVRHGFDAENTTYEAFCDGTWIVVNFATYMPKLPKVPAPSSSSSSSSSSSACAKYPRTLLHDMVVTVTHELAHMLEASGGHGPAWRDTHMALLMEVYADLFPTGRALPGASWANDGAACASCATARSL